MPPKTAITKQAIIQAAFELVRKDGIDAVTARNVALQLHCSTQPIYSVYGNMEELKDDAFGEALRYVFACMQSYHDPSNAAAMNLVIGCLLFARDEKQLFRAIYMSDYSKHYYSRNRDGMSEQMYAAFLDVDSELAKRPDENLRKMFLKLNAYWLGIGTMINTGILELNIEEAVSMLEEMFQLLKEKEGIA